MRETDNIKRNQIVGKVTGSASAINVPIGFKPSSVTLFNQTTNCLVEYASAMYDGDSASATYAPAPALKIPSAVNGLVSAFNALLTWLGANGVINPCTITIGSSATTIATSKCELSFLGVPSEIAADASQAFDAADTINTAGAAGLFFGSWLVQFPTAGTPSIIPAGGLSDQVYTSAAAALAAAKATSPTALHVVAGYVTIGANSGASWTANTDDLTPGSDCVSVNYESVPSSLPSAIVAATGVVETVTTGGISPYDGGDKGYFSAATVSFTASTKRIADSGNNFPKTLKPGDIFTLYADDGTNTGTASANSGDYTVNVASTAGSWVDVEETIADESASLTYEYRDEYAKPEGFTIGTDTDINNASDDIIYIAR